MGSINPHPQQSLSQEGPFQFINPEDFPSLGIDPSSVPLGTFASFKHPSQLRSRFGGNAYGFGLFEDYDRLKPGEIGRLQSVNLHNPDEIRAHYKELNEIYRKMGLLIRFSSHGKRYYLIPVHLMSSSIIHVMAKVDEISKTVGFHRKKFLKEYHKIGVLCRPDDLILEELNLRLKEHHFIVLDSSEKLLNLDQKLDLVILPGDMYEIVLMEKFSPLAREALSKRRLDQYCAYLLWKIRNVLKPEEGEILILADHITARTHQSVEVTFKTEHEEKNFLLFTHVFGTRKRYQIKDHKARVNVFDFQKYLSASFVEQEGINQLLGGRSFEELTVEDIQDLPYLSTPFEDWPFFIDQEKAWSKLLSPFFDKAFLKPVVPDTVRREWEKRFWCKDYSPKYMLIYLGQEKPVKTTVSDVKKDVAKSNLMGCPIELVADYRNSFEYLIRTLKILGGRLKREGHQALPQVFIDRLTLPLESKSRRFSALNDVIKLTKKIHSLERIQGFLNPNGMEGSRTRLFENLEALALFGYSHNELKEIILIALGHTALGRIISGKVNEKALKPVTDLARTYDPQQALNLLRYCRLMTLAETEAARGAELTHEQLQQLFELYESAVSIVFNRDLDWDQLLDEKIAAMGGIHNRIVQKILMMMNYFEFLDNWAELRQKGRMEKEALADYDKHRLKRIQNIIRLVARIEYFEEMYLNFDPIQLPVFHRKFLALTFHGTWHLFERMAPENVFVLLWIAVNVARGEIVNFNPVLADVETLDIEKRIKKVEQEADSINTEHLNLSVLNEFSNQLYREKTSFIMGTGFQLKVSSKTQALEISYIDVAHDIARLRKLSQEIEGRPISDMPLTSLKTLETLFSNLEAFYQSHLRIIHETDPAPSIPVRQKRWFHEVEESRTALRSNFLSVMFRPQSVYSDMDALYRNAPTLLSFLIPEFMALKHLDLSGHLYLTDPITDYIITATRKFQALVVHDRKNYYNTEFLHRLAQKEFGPMAEGIIGVSEVQMETLWAIVDHLKGNPDLMNALTKSLIFQDIGRVPGLREKYRDKINPADLADAGAFLVEKEQIAERYKLTERAKSYLIFLIRHHSLLHHTIRGEISFAALQSTVSPGDRDLFDAFLIASFVSLSAIREDLILEDLAIRLFQIRAMSHRIIDAETTLEEELNKVFRKRGALFCIMERYRNKGLPEGTSLDDCLESGDWKGDDPSKILAAGRMIFATERLLRLRGIRYVEFQDLVNMILKVPLRYIHKKRRFHNVGYATFEKEAYEAFRIYRTLQALVEPARHFILDQLIGDKVRIFGYEKVSGFLSYENQIKLLLIGLLGVQEMKEDNLPISISFLNMIQEIDRRYEAVNDFLNRLSVHQIWDEKYPATHLWNNKVGIILQKDQYPGILCVDFQDRISISRKISYMSSINDLEQLKNYFHYSLRSLRAYPFNTDDYERGLEEAFEKRMTEITDMILNRAENQMGLVKDFEDLHHLVKDLLDRSWDLGFSPEQKHRLNDLYEMRKDALKREKLREVEGLLRNIHEMDELMDCWRGIKWYLQKNRRYFGKEFEYLIAAKFDKAMHSLAAG
ncbi:MAG: hypothetical protein B5M55_00555 [Desulfococcus sp. 4484_242]|nr:MAG: hypothetical protein B5M55_00555 [Desulfococcus sp. 4484_242]